MIRLLAASLLAALAVGTAHAAVEANRASQAELETVKGIGPGLSTKILGARQAGAFKDWADLVDRVGGIGPGNAARFSQAGLTVNQMAYQGPPPAANAAADKPAARAPKAAVAAPAQRP